MSAPKWAVGVRNNTINFWGGSTCFTLQWKCKFPFLFFWLIDWWKCKFLKLLRIKKKSSKNICRFWNLFWPSCVLWSLCCNCTYAVSLLVTIGDKSAHRRTHTCKPRYIGWCRWSYTAQLFEWAISSIQSSIQIFSGYDLCKYDMVLLLMLASQIHLFSHSPLTVFVVFFL